MIRAKAVIITAILAASLSMSYLAYGGSVVGSKHDLSTASTNEPCAFCHTPHFANTTVAAPLWNRAVSSQPFTMYQTTISPQPGAPSSLSLACLGCHDGVLGSFSEVVTYNGYNVNTKHDLINAPGSGGIPDTTSWPNCQRCHPDYYGFPPSTAINMGHDLGDDHPISMDYPTGNAGYNAPPNALLGWGGSSANDIKLYEGRVECPSCHNVHNPDNAPFLRKSNAASALCFTCHIK